MIQAETLSFAVALTVAVASFYITWQGVVGNALDDAAGEPLALWTLKFAFDCVVRIFNFFPKIFLFIKPFIYLSSTVGVILGSIRASSDLHAMKFDKVVNFSLNYIVPVTMTSGAGGKPKPKNEESGERMGRALHAMPCDMAASPVLKRTSSRLSTSSFKRRSMRNLAGSNHDPSLSAHSAYRYNDSGRKYMKVVRDHIVKLKRQDNPQSKIEDIVREVFTALDEDANGFITYDQFARSIKAMDLPKLNDSRIRKMMNVMDQNQDNAIDFEEFKQMMFIEDGESEAKQLRFRTLMEINIDDILYENKAAVKAVMAVAKRTPKAHMFIGMQPSLQTTPDKILEVEKELEKKEAERAKLPKGEGSAAKLRRAGVETELREAMDKREGLTQQFQGIQRLRAERAAKVHSLSQLRKQPPLDRAAVSRPPTELEESASLAQSIAGLDEQIQEALAEWDNSARNSWRWKVSRKTREFKRWFVRKFPRLGNWGMWLIGHPDLKESDFKLVMSSITNRLSSKYSDGYFDFDMELPVVFKKYVFGITYEQDVPQTVAKKLRVMMASVEFLETIHDMSEPLFEFASHKPRWQTLKEMARLYRAGSKFQQGSFIPSLFEIKIWRAYPALPMEQWITEHWTPNRDAVMDTYHQSAMRSADWLERTNFSSSSPPPGTGERQDSMPPFHVDSPHGYMKRNTSRGSATSTHSTESSGVVRISSRGSTCSEPEFQFQL